MITLGNTIVKRKKTYVFMLIIKSHNKVIVNAMDRNNNIQLDIDKILKG
jgi:hypothetical protein